MEGALSAEPFRPDQLTEADWRQLQTMLEDALLKELAQARQVDISEPDWLRTLCLTLAVENVRGFADKVGPGLTILRGKPGRGLLSFGFPKSDVKVPQRRGRPSVRWRKQEREQAVRRAAEQVKEKHPTWPARRVAEALCKQRLVLPGAKSPASQKVIYETLLAANKAYRLALAAALRGPMGLLGVLGGFQPTAPEK
jgi:hypothetical protein